MRRGWTAAACKGCREMVGVVGVEADWLGGGGKG